MDTTNSERAPRGLPMTTWLLLFCIFNLLVTLALFGMMVRRTAGPAMFRTVMNRSMKMDDKTNMKAGMMQGRQKMNPMQHDEAGRMMSGTVNTVSGNVR